MFNKLHRPQVCFMVDDRGGLQHATGTLSGRWQEWLVVDNMVYGIYQEWPVLNISCRFNSSCSVATGLPSQISFSNCLCSDTNVPILTAEVWHCFCTVRCFCSVFCQVTMHAYLKLHRHRLVSQSRSTTSLSWSLSWRSKFWIQVRLNESITSSYLIIELANEFQVAFVFKLMVDGLLKHNTLALLGHEKTQRYCKVVF